MSILLSDSAICGYEGIALGLVFVRYLRLRKEKKQALQMTTLQKEKAREERLDQALKNRIYQESPDQSIKNNIPYEIDFHEETKKQKGKGENIAIQIIEKRKLSTRKYVVFISDIITIGQSVKNTFVVDDLNVAKEQCRIFKHKQDLYIQILEETHPVKVQRKRNEMTLTKDALKLMNGDRILFGETVMEIHFI